MGESKRRKELLGDKYGTPEYSNKRELLTAHKILSDLYNENPYSDIWITEICEFIKKYPDHESLSSPDVSDDFRLDKMSHKNNDPQNSEDIQEKLTVVFESMSEFLNSEISPFKIDFKVCNPDSEQDAMAVMFLIALGMDAFYAGKRNLDKAMQLCS